MLFTKYDYIIAVGFNLKWQVRFLSPSCFMRVFNFWVCGLLCSVMQAKTLVSSDCYKLTEVGGRVKMELNFLKQCWKRVIKRVAASQDEWRWQIQAWSSCSLDLPLLNSLGHFLKLQLLLNHCAKYSVCEGDVSPLKVLFFAYTGLTETCCVFLHYFFSSESRGDADCAETPTQFWCQRRKR